MKGGKGKETSSKLLQCHSNQSNFFFPLSLFFFNFVVVLYFILQRKQAHMKCEVSNLKVFMWYTYAKESFVQVRRLCL